MEVIIIEKIIFNQNGGQGGFETGAYDSEAIHPGPLNWTWQSRFSGPDKPAKKWVYKKDNAFITPCIDDSLAVDIESNIYIADSSGNIYVLNKNGTGLNNIFKIERELGQPILVNDKSIYIYTTGAHGTKGHKLYNITSTGSLQKTLEINELMLAPPVLGNNSEIYTVTEGSELRSYSEDGKLNWVFKKRFEYWGMPVISSSNIIYIGSGKHLYALDKQGRELWNLETGRTVDKSPIVNKNGDFFVCTNTSPGFKGNLLSINQEGNILWKYELKDGSFGSNPSISNNGLLYMGANFWRIFAIGPDGNKKNEMTTNKGFLKNKVLIDHNGTLYLGLYNKIKNRPTSWICAIDKDNKEKWTYKFKGSLNAFVIGKNKTIYALLNTWGRTQRDRNWELHLIGDKADL